MIIKTIALSSALASCSIPQTRPPMHVLSVPVRQERREQEGPEKTEPPHGEGSGESPMFGGMAVYGNANISNTASVSVDSGASGTQPYTSVAWLPNRFPLIVSMQEFEVEPLVPRTPQKMVIQAAPNAARNLRNLSGMHIQRAVTRRRV